MFTTRDVAAVLGWRLGGGEEELALKMVSCHGGAQRTQLWQLVLTAEAFH